jgi:1-acyl-sn-glycerol-3-phosphate acyltransferase
MQQNNFATKLLSIAIWTTGTVLTILLFFAVLFFTIILYPFDKQRRVVHAQCFWWADIVTKINPFWKIHVSGFRNANRHKAYVIVANHQSMADIIILYKTKLQFKWVAKESLLKIPVIGWCLGLSKHIMLKRGDYSSIKKLYKEAGDYLKNNMSVLFFPEGTRSRTNDMNTFQSGAFKLAIKEKKPILPVVLTGTRNAIPRGSWVFNTKIHCTVKILPPIETKTFSMGDFEKLKEITLKNFALVSL